MFPIPKLADFGLGQFGDNNIVGGTPGFIAPEILKGSYTEKCDAPYSSNHACMVSLVKNDGFDNVSQGNKEALNDITSIIKFN